MSIVSTTTESVRPSQTQTVDWRSALKSAIRDPVALIRMLNLSDEFVGPAQTAAQSFRLFAPLEYITRIKLGDPHDPLLRQVLPLGEEFQQSAGFVTDPVGDLQSVRTPGMLHKYHGRVLLVVTGVCPVHCRYCFRRHFPYREGPRSMEDWAGVLEMIAADQSIEEVILSGGDPLTVVDSQLGELVGAIEGISHVQRLRIHTRMPIMIPQRVTTQMLAWLRETRLTTVVVVHANHPHEIDRRVANALRAMAAADVTVLNQSVLLRGVNDNANVLIDLSKRLFQARAMPYYLHQLDRVTGAAHFEVSENEGRAIVEQMRCKLPGYLVPKFVRETAGELSKSVLC